MLLISLTNTLSLLGQGETEVCCVYFSQRFSIFAKPSATEMEKAEEGKLQTDDK